MLPSQPGAMFLPKVTLPLNTLQVNTAYSLLRTLRLFYCENPGVLNTTSALVQLPPVGDAQSPYQVPLFGPFPPIAAFSIMSTRIDFIGPTLILIRPFDWVCAISRGDSILQYVWGTVYQRTWHGSIFAEEGPRCKHATKAVEAGRFCWTFGKISGLYRAAEISAAKLTNPSGTSRHINHLLLLFPVCLS